MQHFYLLRHGQVAADAALYGVTDVAVLPKIDAKIEKSITMQSLKFSGIYTSPLQRCKTLAQRLLKSHLIHDADKYNNSITTVNALQEMNFGIFDGVLFDDIYRNSAQWQLLEQFWQSPNDYPLPKAEPLTEFYQRVSDAWQTICQRHYQAELAAPVTESNNQLIVCHGGVIRMILAHIMNDNIQQKGWYQQHKIGYGSLTHITLTQGKASVISIAKPCPQTFSKDLV